MIEMHVRFFGQVQGVFFRATARDIAVRMGLKGSVKNLPDGSVELVAQGEQDDVEDFILKLTQQFYLDPKRPYEKTISEPTKVHDDFRIVY